VLPPDAASESLVNQAALLAAALAQKPGDFPLFREALSRDSGADAVGALPATYEFTVRLRDGSTRLSSDASQSNWRAGDAIMLIGGVSSAIQH
jgi:hypothetical protein